MLDKSFKDFILDNNVFNIEKLSMNGMKTGKSTSFYKENELIFTELLNKYQTDNLLECLLLELNLITKKACTCGNKTKFSSRKKAYLDYCSKKCSSIAANTKREKTYLERYGAKHPMHNTEVKGKQKETNLKRYGSKNVFSSSLVKERIKETNLERYGVEYPSQKDDFIEKMTSTNLERYGVEYPMQLSLMKEQRNDTLKEIYGDMTYRPISNKEDLTVEFICNNFVDENDFILIEDVLEYYSCCRNYWVTKIKPLLPDRIKVKQARKLEQQNIIKYIQKLYNGLIIQDDRKELEDIELDIFIPGLKFAIEYNGLPFHSYGKSTFTAFDNIHNEDKNRHLKKTIMCDKKSIDLFQIYEDEWKNPIKKDIWKSMISNKLGINEKIYARKCVVKEIDSSVYRSFCNENHLQGSSNASVRLGLYYLDELVFLISLGKPRFNKNCEWELLRACSKKYFSVIGGFSKLMKHFKDRYKGDIITYANRSYSSGNVYLQNGFIELKNSPPNYRYIKLNTKESISRYEAQKHKLKNKLAYFDNTLTEKQNMLENGYRILWDSGNKVFICANK